MKRFNLPTLNWTAGLSPKARRAFWTGMIAFVAALVVDVAHLYFAFIRPGWQIFAAVGLMSAYAALVAFSLRLVRRNQEEPAARLMLVGLMVFFPSLAALIANVSLVLALSLVGSVVIITIRMLPRDAAMGWSVAGGFVGLITYALDFIGLSYRLDASESQAFLQTFFPGFAAVIALLLLLTLLTSAASRYLNRLTYVRKFTLVGVFLALPLILAIGLLFIETNDRIDKYGRREVYGTLYLRQLQAILAGSDAHDRALRNHAEGLGSVEAVTRAQSQVDSAFANLADLDTRYGTLLRSREAFARLRQDWDNYAREALQLAPGPRVGRLEQFKLDVQALIADVGDSSYLILDPELDMYYQMDVVLLKLPANQGTMAEMYRIVIETIGGETLSTGARSRLLANTSNLRDSLKLIEKNLEIVYSSDPSGTVKPQVAAAFADYRSAVIRYAYFVENELVLKPGNLVNPDRDLFDAIVTETFGLQDRFYAAVSQTLERSIQTRVSNLTLRQYGLISFAVLSGLLVFLLGSWVIRSAVQPLIRLTEATRKLAGGDMSVRVNVVSEDEAGQLTLAFNSMARQLQSSQAEIAARNLALSLSADVSRRLSTILDEHQLVHEVVEQVRSAFNYYHAHVYLFDETRQELVMVGGTGEVGALLMERGHRLPSGRGLVGRAAETNTPIVVPDTSSDPDWIPNPLLPDTKAEIAVPITVAGEAIGVLDVQQNVVGGLGQVDIDLLRSIANQVGIALQNARIYSQTQRRAEREAFINSVSQQIQSALTVENVLQVAARELGQRLSVRRSTAQVVGLGRQRE